MRLFYFLFKWNYALLRLASFPYHYSTKFPWPGAIVKNNLRIYYKFCYKENGTIMVSVWLVIQVWLYVM